LTSTNNFTEIVPEEPLRWRGGGKRKSVAKNSDFGAFGGHICDGFDAGSHAGSSAIAEQLVTVIVMTNISHLLLAGQCSVCVVSELTFSRIIAAMPISGSLNLVLISTNALFIVPYLLSY